MTTHPKIQIVAAKSYYPGFHIPHPILLDFYSAVRIRSSGIGSSGER